MLRGRCGRGSIRCWGNVGTDPRALCCPGFGSDSGVRTRSYACDNVISETGVGHASAKPRYTLASAGLRNDPHLPSGSDAGLPVQSPVARVTLLNNLTSQIGFSETMSGYLPL
jgi:hypothetical protein